MGFFFFYDNSKAYSRAFKKLKIDLPIRWDGDDFLKTIKQYIEKYLLSIDVLLPTEELNEIKDISSLIISSVEYYLNGSPSLAYNKINMLIEKYLYKFAVIYEPNMDYYRIARVSNNCSYPRERIFHPPFSMRNLISTNRYSIAGYPCLYLSTDLNLCFKEINYNPYEDYYIASKFRISNVSNDSVRLLDLSVKPQDVIVEKNSDDFMYKVPYDYKKYLYIFPLIMACSFIRTDRKAPFAPEYIVPQLLLECLKNQYGTKKEAGIIGIKYFSCSSMANSNIGYNIVFPTYKKKENRDYCEVLNNIFELTKPEIVNDYNSVEDCKKSIDNLTEYKSVMSRSI